MDFEDIFRKKNKYRSAYRTSKQYDYDDNYHYSGKQGRFNPFELIKSILRNKKLRIIIIALVVLALLVIIGLIILFLPLIGKLINYVYEHGISGIIELIGEQINTLWYGAE